VVVRWGGGVCVCVCWVIWFLDGVYMEFGMHWRWDVGCCWGNGVFRLCSCCQRMFIRLRMTE